MMDKKGQITMFIIIGIVLLVGTGIILFLRSEFITSELEVQLELDKVSDEAKPIQDHVVQCIKDIGKDAVLRVASHGGYLDPGNLSLTSQSFVINKYAPTESDVVEVTNDHLVPYWWFMEGSNRCENCFITIRNMPSVESMEEEVSKYVSMKFLDCINEFESFEDRNILVEPEGPHGVMTDIIEDKVYVQVNYPLKVEYSGKTESMENFYGELNADLMGAYEAAKEITELQIQQQFLEQILMNLITAYGGIDSERLPPIGGITEGYVVEIWTESNVRDDLEKYLQSNIPLIQVENTKDAVKIEPETELGQGFAELMFIENEKDFNDKEVQFLFMDWDIFLEVTPSLGELIRPNIFRVEFPLNIARPIQTNHYYFYYDVSYPAVVYVRDETAFAGEGLSFMMALEANVRNNIDIIRWINGEGTDPHFDLDSVEVNVSGEEVPVGVDLETNETIYEEMEAPAPSLMCDQNQKISGDIKVAVYDKLTEEPIEEATIGYQCGKSQSCSVGATDDDGHYNGLFPICVGGFLKVDKTGYLTSIVELSILPGQEDNIIVFMEPFRDKKVEIQLIPAARLNLSWSVEQTKGLSFDPYDYDTTIINLLRAPEKAFEPVVSKLVEVHGTEQANVSLVPGTYQVDISFMNEEGIIIPARIEDYEGYEVEYPEVDMTPAFLGGASFNNATGYWVIDEETLDNNEVITFYVFRMNDPIVVEDLGAMGQFSNHSLFFREYMEPDWS